MIVVANSPLFGQNLKYLRQRQNLSLVQMAALLHMEPGTLYRLEQGLTFEIDGDSLRTLYRTFDVEPDGIFYLPLSEGV